LSEEVQGGESTWIKIWGQNIKDEVVEELGYKSVSASREKLDCLHGKFKNISCFKNFLVIGILILER